MRSVSFTAQYASEGLQIPDDGPGAGGGLARLGKHTPASLAANTSRSRSLPEAATPLTTSRAGIQAACKLVCRRSSPAIEHEKGERALYIGKRY